ncbi:hypothetical protein F5878DRAFT_519845, partial [Lentinula raphanica]
EIPTPERVSTSIQALEDILHPRRCTGRGYKVPDLNHVLRARLELMIGFLRLYKAARHTGWGRCADMMAIAAGKGAWLSRMIRQWTVLFCKNHDDLPTAEYGKFNSSVLEDEDLSNDIHLHLQSLGKWIRAENLVHYVLTPEFQQRFKLKKGISLRTAQRWMKRMEYRWQAEPK